jgi:Cu(I)/Ag(I) efflux system membrane fusion protein/cobalt-zinc-cadmium efflux system membrane fusion protein
MGMDLVPVYADGANSSEGMITINPVVVQNMNVRTAPVQQKDLSTVVRAVGKVEYDEQKLFNVNPKISGWVEQLYVDYTGKMVQRGQPLFSIYSPELVTTQQEYLLALKTQNKVASSSFEQIRAGGISLLEATRKRLEYWDIPDSEINELEQSGKVKKAVTLKSPATGVVLHKNAIEGEYIKASTPAYKIADLSTIWVQTSVYDYEVPWIEEGQPAQMALSYQPGKTYEGTVAYVYPTLDQKTRTVQVRLEFSNPNLELKPGMFANVRIQTRPKSNVTVIPNEAIIRTGERNIVFVAKGEGSFEPREVTLGMEGGERNNEIEILEGVKPGEEIVTSAQFLFDSESRLQEAIQKMLQQKQDTSDMENMDMSGGEMNYDETPVDTTDHSNMDMTGEEMNHDEMPADTTDHSNMNMKING